ncbi:acyltransferase family protein [Leifsonia sp. F6_8S_P_1B]|uniref:Acyltransferase family protein n=1 Tax=Leifsonia williamsii TaxID=3035919 RepID=A0ABT8KGG8_9MICO|nr:acyltransferase family protein [Leifsonia williamsii]MDN4616087.1 acyltransferase family protein [Leifsonia williamsii]
MARVQEAVAARTSADAGPSRPVERPRFRPDLEGLRALAVLLVVANHAVGWPSGGFVGVDVFFVLSGYLITRGLLHQQERDGRVGLARFFVRRVARLLPAAVVVVAVTASACLLLFFPITSVPLLFDGAAALLSVENWALIRQGADYLDPAGAVSPFQHFWSLSVEEQFYATWPWLLVLAWAVALRAGRWGGSARRVVATCAAVAVVVSFTLSVALTERTAAAAYFLPVTRAWELGGGALLAAAGAACVARLRLGVRPLLVTGLRWTGIGMIALAAVMYSPATPFPGAAAGLPVLGAMLVVLAGEVPGAPASALTLRPVRWVGRISYSLYLWHAPLLLLLPVALRGVAGPDHGDDLLVTGVALLLAGLLAAATYRFVEAPARRARVWETLRRRLRVPGSPRWTRIAGVGVTAVAVVALSVVQWRGPVPEARGAEPLARPEAVASTAQLQDRLQKAVRGTDWRGYDRQLSAGALTGAAEMACMRDPLDGSDGGSAPPFSWTTLPVCLPDPAAPRRAVVIGDSIAMSYVPAVREALDDGWGIAAVGLQSCPSALVRVGEARGRPGYADACRRSREQDLQAVARMKPDLVVLASAESGMRRLASGATGREAAAEWQRGLEKSLERLAGTRARIVVLENPPETTSPVDCAARTSTPAACVRPVSAAWTLKSDAERRAVSEAAARGTDVTLVDTLPWFCVDGGCPVGDGRLIARIDHGHLTADYARMLGPLLRSALAEPAEPGDAAALTRAER